MSQLQLSDNSKTKFRKNHSNTFGLMYGLPQNGGTCPGATTGAGGCLDVRDGHKRETCYMAKITQIYKAVGSVLVANTSLLVGKTQQEMVEVLTNTVAEFVRKNKAHPDKLKFRLHYSGDFFSDDYAMAWAVVINKFPQVRFWAYSRSHSVAKFFVNCPNLTFYFSVDVVNFNNALAHWKEVSHLPNFGLAWLGTTEPPDPELFRWVTCPETSGKVKNLPDSGACSRCRLCIDNYKIKVKHIKFLVH